MGSGASRPATSGIRLKRAYEAPETGDGVRVLVDRLWARGVSKDTAKLDAWMKELGPTTELRTWFGHQPERWNAFADKYRHELATPLRQLLLAELQGIAARSTLTLVYGARDTQENEAVVLHDTLVGGTIHLGGAWDAPTKLLITASVVAAARHDASAPSSDLKLFVSPVLTGSEFDAALDGLATSGKLRMTSTGWQLTSLGNRTVRKHASVESAKGALS
jgi:uncharacterized protein YeaO (DUF488 family)